MFHFFAIALTLNYQSKNKKVIKYYQSVFHVCICWNKSMGMNWNILFLFVKKVKFTLGLHHFLNYLFGCLFLFLKKLHLFALNLHFIQLWVQWFDFRISPTIHNLWGSNFYSQITNSLGWLKDIDQKKITQDRNFLPASCSKI